MNNKTTFIKLIERNNGGKFNRDSNESNITENEYGHQNEINLNDKLLLNYSYNDGKSKSNKIFNNMKTDIQETINEDKIEIDRAEERNERNIINSEINFNENTENYEVPTFKEIFCSNYQCSLLLEFPSGAQYIKCPYYVRMESINCGNCYVELLFPYASKCIKCMICGIINLTPY